MSRMKRFSLSAAVVLAAWPLAAGPGRADDELAKRASWSQPDAASVKAELDKWLADRELDEPTRLKIAVLWPAEGGPSSGTERLEQLAATIAIVDQRARDLVVLCRDDRRPLVLPEFPLLADEKTPPLVRNNLRLLYGRWLAQQELYDESLAQIGDLRPEDVVDPASLLFYQSVAHHRFRDKEECLPTLARLLENEESIPRRYATVARLMEADLKPMKPDSLDEVSRLMDEIDRRLGLGRAGKRVRREEEDVIAKLDKMIDELEKQRQQAAAAAAGGAQSTRPMPDSMPGGGTGPGNVEPKKFGNKGDWGNLPPKQRQEALQQISRQFPSHYREAIEEYFRKLARDGVED